MIVSETFVIIINTASYWRGSRLVEAEFGKESENFCVMGLR